LVLFLCKFLSFPKYNILACRISILMSICIIFSSILWFRRCSDGNQRKTILSRTMGSHNITQRSSPISEPRKRILISRTRPNQDNEPIIVNSRQQRSSPQRNKNIQPSQRHKKVISGGKQIKTLLRCDHTNEGPVWGASNAKRNLDCHQLAENDEMIKKRRIDNKIDNIFKKYESGSNPVYPKHSKVVSDGRQLKTILRCEHIPVNHPKPILKQINHGQSHQRKHHSEIFRPGVSEDVSDQYIDTSDSSDHSAIRKKTIKSNVRVNVNSNNMRNVYGRHGTDENSVPIVDIYPSEEDGTDELHNYDYIPPVRKGRRVSFDDSCKYCQEDNNTTPTSCHRRQNIYKYKHSQDLECPGCIRNRREYNNQCLGCKFCTLTNNSPVNKYRDCCHCCPKTNCSKGKDISTPQCHSLLKEKSGRCSPDERIYQSSSGSSRVLRSSSRDRRSSLESEVRNCIIHYLRSENVL